MPISYFFCRIVSNHSFSLSKKVVHLSVLQIYFVFSKDEEMYLLYTIVNDPVWSEEVLSVLPTLHVYDIEYKLTILILEYT